MTSKPKPKAKQKNSFKFAQTFKEMVRHIFRSVHQSMRRKITFDYLLVYIIISLISVVGIPLIFVIFEIQEDVVSYESEFSQLIISHDKGLYTDAQLQYKIQQLSDEEAVEFEMTIFYKENDKVTKLSSENYGRIESKDGLFENVDLLFSYGVVKSTVTSSLFGEISENRYIVTGIVPIRNYKFNIILIAFTIIVFNCLGLFLMSTIGGARVRKVLNPIFYMTKTAEQISISDLDKRLDVEHTKYELKDLAITINDMLDRLDEDYTKQKRFVSDVSHELRTPISIINGYASMLERWGKQDEEILEESIDAIIGESKNMQLLVENLLTLVRSDNQTLKFEFSSFSLSKMIVDITREFNMVNTKDQYITCEVDSEVDVLMDLGKVKQMLRIFIDNAVKYTPKDGGIHIELRKNNNDLSIHIKDSGIGISREDLPRLFERFYRSDESRTRQTGGHGLGLAIAKVIVIGHGGKIRVKSKLGKGSEFILIFPDNKQ